VLHKGTDPVDYRVITPPGWDGSRSLPLFLVLHGSFSSSAILDEHVAAYESAFPDAIVACASTPTQGGFYICTGSCGTSASTTTITWSRGPTTSARRSRRGNGEPGNFWQRRFTVATLSRRRSPGRRGTPAPARA
jgi:hypothetical protein